jgi:hypothetical protein
MRITASQLRKIISQEVRSLNEGIYDQIDDQYGARDPSVSYEGPHGARADLLYDKAEKKAGGLSIDFLNKLIALDKNTFDLIADVIGTVGEREELEKLLNSGGVSGYDY